MKPTGHETEPDKRVTVNELAAAVGVEPPAIYRWIKRGAVERGADGLLWLRASVRAIEAARTKTPTGGRPRKDAVPPVASVAAEPAAPRAKKTLNDWALVKAREEALTKRLARRQKQGSLVDRAAAEQAAATAFADLRSHLDGVGRAVQDKLAGETNPRVCGDIVQDAIRAVLTKLADRGLEIRRDEGEEEDEDE